MLFVGALIGMFDVRRPMLDVQCRMCGVVLYCDECRYDTSGSSSLYGNGNGETGPVGLGGEMSKRPQRGSIHFHCSQGEGGGRRYGTSARSGAMSAGLTHRRCV